MSNNDKEIEAKNEIAMDPSVDVNRRTITDIVWLSNEEFVIFSPILDPK